MIKIEIVKTWNKKDASPAVAANIITKILVLLLLPLNLVILWLFSIKKDPQMRLFDD